MLRRYSEKLRLSIGRELNQDPPMLVRVPIRGRRPVNQVAGSFNANSGPSWGRDFDCNVPAVNQSGDGLVAAVPITTQTPATRKLNRDLDRLNHGPHKASRFGFHLAITASAKQACGQYANRSDNHCCAALRVRRTFEPAHALSSLTSCSIRMTSCWPSPSLCGRLCSPQAFRSLYAAAQHLAAANPAWSSWIFS